MPSVTPVTSAVRPFGGRAWRLRRAEAGGGAEGGAHGLGEPGEEAEPVFGSQVPDAEDADGHARTEQVRRVRTGSEAVRDRP